jgi:hypothetical protein
MMKVFYYYYFLFYKSLNDDNPRVTTVLVFSFSESLLVNGVVNIILAYFFCWAMTKYYMLGILVIILLLNFFIFLTPERIKEIVNSKPMFFGSHRLSIAFTLLFFLTTMSTLFWIGYYLDAIIRNCHLH